MFEQWLKFWRQWMFWWLPGGDQPEETKPAPPAQKKSAPAEPKTEAAKVDAGASQPVSNEPSATAAQADDLTAIRGIGPAIARKLDALGVTTFADLAAADPDDLAAKIARRPVTSNRVREWIAEAKKRA